MLDCRKVIVSCPKQGTLLSCSQLTVRKSNPEDQVKRLYLLLAGLLVALLGSVSAASAAAPDSVETAPSAQLPLHSTAVQDPQVSGGVSAQAATCETPVNVTNALLQTKTVTSSTARFYTSTDWTNLECGQLTVSVPRDMRGGLVVRTDAELTCTGPTPDQTQWCLGRVLVNGVEGYPKATEADGSFAWAQSSPDAGAWESNSFTRSLTLRCPTSSTTNLPCMWNVQVQVRNHVDGLTFRVDDSTVEAQLTYAP